MTENVRDKYMPPQFDALDPISNGETDRGMLDTC